VEDGGEESKAAPFPEEGGVWRWGKVESLGEYQDKVKD